MDIHNIKLGKFKFLLVVVVLSSFMLGINAQTTGTSGFISGLCSGTTTTSSSSGAIIPATNVLSGNGTGANNLLFLCVVIMLIMLFIVALIYMISYVFNLDLLKNLAKLELGEIVITAIVVFIFLGLFNALAAASSTGTGFVGTGFGRNVFVNDCGYLGNASVNMLVPILFVNTVRYLGETATSFTVTLEPSNWGFAFQPFAGYNMFDNLLGYLDDMASAFALLDLAAMVMLGIIFGLFPLFLYAGIVLRTLPWTRAAGGAMLGLFAGFYIAFPLLLHIMLSVYIPTIPATAAYTITPNSIFTSLAATSVSPALGGAVNILQNSQLYIFGNQYGIINGFIADVIEPSLFTFLAILVAFMISFDITEALGDVLGAPSLTVSSIFKKVPGVS